LTPTFAKIAVKAAKTADKAAQKNQLLMSLVPISASSRAALAGLARWLDGCF
jgi:hypothetical protein